MIDLYKKILSSQDNSLYLPIERDPLGFQPIWTTLAGDIFQGVTTSVSNDIRSYTINLVHHLSIYKLKTEHKELWIKLRHRMGKSEGVSEVETQTRLILALEMALAFGATVQKWEERTGIFGIGTAKKRWQDDPSNANWADLKNQPSDPGRKRPNKEDEGDFTTLLVRQVGLGINGRYKGALKSMGILDGAGLYSTKAEEKLTLALNLLDPEYQELASELTLFLAKSEQSDFVLKFDPSENVFTCYQKAFNKKEIGKGATEFWMQSMGFARDSVAREIFLSLQDDKTNRTSYEKAKDAFTNHSGSVLVERITAVEPFLVQCEMLFSELLRNENKDLNLLFQGVKEAASEINWGCEKIQKIRRLTNIGRIAQSNSPEEMASGIVEHHLLVCEEKENFPWISKVGKVNKKINFVKETPSILEKIRKGESSAKDVPWRRDYYTHSVLSIQQGMIL